MKINAGITAVAREERQLNLKLRNQSFEQGNDFKYLWIRRDNKGVKREVDDRVNAAAELWSSLLIKKKYQ